jgi:hypothetical protein
VLARWLEEIFPRSAADTHSQVNREGGANRLEAAHTIKKLQGRAHTKQRRVVCDRCNNGWMARNQAACKDILVALIRGLPTEIDEHQQRNIALWSARSAMTAEFLDEKRRSIPQSHRTWLLENLEPPDGWFIWVAGYGGTWPLEHVEILSQEAGTIAPSRPSNMPGPYRAHSTTIGLGRLLIYVAAIDLPNQRFEIPDGLMQPIWPQQSERIVWPPARLASDDEVWFLATSYLRHLPLNVPVDWLPPRPM